MLVKKDLLSNNSVGTVSDTLVQCWLLIEGLNDNFD